MRVNLSWASVTKTITERSVKGNAVLECGVGMFEGACNMLAISVASMNVSSMYDNSMSDNSMYDNSVSDNSVCDNSVCDNSMYDNSAYDNSAYDNSMYNSTRKLKSDVSGSKTQIQYDAVKHDTTLFLLRTSCNWQSLRTNEKELLNFQFSELKLMVF